MVTSRDVARLAGVSQPTVSRALRDDARVSAETRARVRDAAVALGYVLSQAGRALSSGRTHRIGLLLTDLDNQFYPHLIAPAHRELERLGYQLVLRTESSDSSTVAGRLIADGLDGVLLATTTLDSAVPLRLRDRGLPFVYLNRTSDAVEADSATIDPTPGFAQAVAAVAEAGHEQVAAILGPSNTSTAQGREAALRDALADHRLTLPARLTRRGPFDTVTGERATDELLGLDAPPTVIFCGNDVVAFGALNAARRRAVDVPGQVSIIGFDNLPTATWPIVELTTIAFDLETLVHRAARLLVSRIEEPDREIEHAVFTTSLVRRSTLASQA